MKDKYQNMINKTKQFFDGKIADAKGKTDKTMWNDDLSRQQIRFDEIYRFMDSNDASVMDIGGANGDFYTYLKSKGFKGSYMSVDIHETFLADGRKKHPECKFINTDILTDTSLRPCDYVVMSGLFNGNYGQDFDFIKNFVIRMYGLCKKKLVFNALTTRHLNHASDALYRIDPCMFLDFIINEVSPLVELRHFYLSFNYTVCITKGK
tara:strand:- start:608 stop:1231 length:624 start_codon:yes stop_codon:yes gene_type:complete